MEGQLRIMDQEEGWNPAPPQLIGSAAWKDTLTRQAISTWRRGNWLYRIAFGWCR